MPLAVVYTQNLNPIAQLLPDLPGSAVLSTVFAALPVLLLFYLLVQRRWLASWAGAAGAGSAILIAWLVFAMPLKMATASFIFGVGFGLLPIGWTIFNAMLLYNITVETGQFTIIRRSVRLGRVGEIARAVREAGSALIEHDQPREGRLG